MSNITIISYLKLLEDGFCTNWKAKQTIESENMHWFLLPKMYCFSHPKEKTKNLNEINQAD